jgi:hypothetical protein
MKKLLTIALLTGLLSCDHKGSQDLQVNQQTHSDVLAMLGKPDVVNESGFPGNEVKTLFYKKDQIILNFVNDTLREIAPAAKFPQFTKSAEEVEQARQDSLVRIAKGGI